MSSVAFLWNTHDFSQSEELRPEFWGTERISPITGKPEIFFPVWRRYIRFFFSFLAMQPMLVVAVVAMLLSLNLNGYIKDVDSPVHIATLAKFAEPVFTSVSFLVGLDQFELAGCLLSFVLNCIFKRPGDSTA